jgi:hypothetical protein
MHASWISSLLERQDAPVRANGIQKDAGWLSRILANGTSAVAQKMGFSARPAVT